MFAYRRSNEHDKNLWMNSRQLVISTVPIVLAAVTLGGCYKPVSAPVIVDLPRVAAKPAVRRYIAGKSVENRSIECIVLGTGQDVTLILATMHGNEQAGTPLVLHLETYLQNQPYLLNGRKVVLLALANPDGAAKNRHFNANGVDLNRNFATANRRNSRRFGRAALSEPEARVIRRLIEIYAPDRIVSIHQPLTCIDYDGPGIALARRMAEHCDLPIKKLGARPGSLGSYAGLTLGIPIITLELPRSADALDEQSLWDKYGAALVAAVAYPEMAK